MLAPCRRRLPRVCAWPWSSPGPGPPGSPTASPWRCCAPPRTTASTWRGSAGRPGRSRAESPPALRRTGREGFRPRLGTRWPAPPTRPPRAGASASRPRASRCRPRVCCGWPRTPPPRTAWRRGASRWGCWPETWRTSRSAWPRCGRPGARRPLRRGCPTSTPSPRGPAGPRPGGGTRPRSARSPGWRCGSVSAWSRTTWPGRVAGWPPCRRGALRLALRPAPDAGPSSARDALEELGRSLAAAAAVDLLVPAEAPGG